MGKPKAVQAAEHLQAFFFRARPVINLPNPVAMEVDESGHGPMLLPVPSPVLSGGDLSPLFSRHRAVVCVGAGGVGKTTVAAALALAAACSGKRTLCLTIDPARRLAGSLGLSSFPRQEMQIPQEFFDARGLAVAAPLTVMMLDAKETFDGLIHQFAKDRGEAERIIQHRVYHHLASHLAGTQSYMAMEKVLSVLDDQRYDFIVLDTPPSDRALDFFDAPRKMAEILDSPATRALVQAIEQGKRFRLNLLAAGFRRAMKGIERITGTTLIADVAELLFEMNGLFGGFAGRAAQVDGRLRGSEFGYVLVTAPGEGIVTDAHAMIRSMKERSLRVDALAVNRVAQPGVLDATEADLEALADAGLSKEGVARAVTLSVLQEKARRRQLERCQPLIRELTSGALASFLPAFAEDVHEPEKLMSVAKMLAPSHFRAAF